MGLAIVLGLVVVKEVGGEEICLKGLSFFMSRIHHYFCHCLTLHMVLYQSQYITQALEFDTFTGVQKCGKECLDHNLKATSKCGG